MEVRGPAGGSMTQLVEFSTRICGRGKGTDLMDMVVVGLLGAAVYLWVLTVTLA